MIETYVQIGIFCITMFSSYCNSGKTARSRALGYSVALCGQPLWIYTTFVHQQWGLFALSMWYILIAIRGIRNNSPIKYQASSHN